MITEMFFMKPICVPCQRFFRPKKNGFYFLEGMPVGPGLTSAGTSEPEKWRPYKIWVGDRYECDGCGAVIISGFGRSAIGEHWQSDFTEKIKALGADQFQVNDC